MTRYNVGTLFVQKDALRRQLCIIKNTLAWISSEGTQEEIQRAKGKLRYLKHSYRQNKLSREETNYVISQDPENLALEYMGRANSAQLQTSFLLRQQLWQARAG